MDDLNWQVQGCHQSAGVYCWGVIYVNCTVTRGVTSRGVRGVKGPLGGHIHLHIHLDAIHVVVQGVSSVKEGLVAAVGVACAGSLAVFRHHAIQLYPSSPHHICRQCCGQDQLKIQSLYLSNEVIII